MSQYCNRIPVVYRNKPLMPTTWKRAKKYCKLGYGRLMSTKDNIQYLKLLKSPSGFNIQPIVLGIDPGSMYDGFTVLSKCNHLLNIELIHTKDIKKRMDKRRGYRRIRRNRLWHRPTRFDNRTSSKLSPTIKSKVEFRIWMIKELLKLYPISDICIEDVRFNHYKNKDGKYFSQVEIGKKYLYGTIKLLGINLHAINGYDTKNERIKIFGDDLKVYKKDSKSFFAHCIDSLAIANTIIHSSALPNYRVYFIKREWLCRRELYREKCKVKDSKYFYKYKSGKKIIFKKISKSRKIRVKINDSKSNHGPWEYKYPESMECLKKFRSRYGGTIVIGGPRWNSRDIGQSKRLVMGNYNHYKNRDVLIVYPIPKGEGSRSI